MNVPIGPNGMRPQILARHFLSPTRKLFGFCLRKIDQECFPLILNIITCNIAAPFPKFIKSQFTRFPSLVFLHSSSFTRLLLSSVLFPVGFFNSMDFKIANSDLPLKDPRLDKDIVFHIAQCIPGFNSELKDELATALVTDAEYRIREIIQEAFKFMRHSKRSTMTTDDIDAALRVRNVEPLYGFSSRKEFKFTKVVPTSGTIQNEEIYYVEDDEVDLFELIHEKLPPVPTGPTLGVHWLAIEGVQPAISSNPPPQSGADSQSAKRKHTEPQVEVKPLVKHVLSRELQLYYDHIVKVLRENNSAHVKVCLRNLSDEPGIQQLLPYFTLFIHDEVMHNLRNLPYLRTILDLVLALFKNPYFGMEPYLHQLLPPILTCLVGKRLCNKPQEDHWNLRDTAARIVSIICKTYGGMYMTLQPRITKTLVPAFLDTGKPLTTHYGAIVGLTGLGFHVISSHIIPHMQPYLEILEEELGKLQKMDDGNESSSMDEKARAIRKLEISKVYGALMMAAGKYVQHKDATEMDDALVIKNKVGKANDPKQGDRNQEEDRDMMMMDLESMNEHDRQSLKEIIPEFEERYRSLRDEFGESLFPFYQGRGKTDDVFSSKVL